MPDIELDWQGAAPGEIAEIEAIAGRPLPDFYRWFLTRMGSDMGALSFATMDFTAARVIECYREEIEERDFRYLLIGYQNDPVVPMHTWYDLDRPNRGDALILSRELEDDSAQLDYETFREKLAKKAMLNFRIDALPFRCKGCFDSKGKDARTPLERAIDILGFERPIPTGPFCGIFDRDDAAMVCSVTPNDGAADLLFFRLAAQSAGTMRRILGVIAKETGLEVDVDG